MSRNFGNQLVGNRQGLASAQSPRPADASADTFGELNERVIILSREDIQVEGPTAPPLDWTSFEKGEIAIQLKDTEGLADGNVTVRATALQRIHPALLPIQLEREYLFPISLKAVVLQVQAHLRAGSEVRPNSIGPDFDTPIAQAAREDEGFFKLAKIAETKETPISEMVQAKRKISGPILTPADRPVPPAVGKKSSEYSDGGLKPPAVSEKRALAHTEHSEIELGREKLARSRGGVLPGNPVSRNGLERLREIFMTEDHLDAPEVAKRLAALPKVISSIILLGDGMVLGGTLPEGYNLETVGLAPVMMRGVREFNRSLRSNEITAFTLLGDHPLTFFAEGNVHILISHEGRGFLPGVRERIGEVARALDALCGGTSEMEISPKGSSMKANTAPTACSTVAVDSSEGLGQRLQTEVHATPDTGYDG